MRVACSAGGLIVKDNKVLLVKIAYGANKDYWMIPGGFVEEGETFEEAAIREVKEESGIVARPKRLVGVRTGTKELQNGLELGIYFIFEMELISGDLLADGSEISEVQFRPVDEVLKDSQVISLTQEILRTYTNTLPNSGLSKVENPIQTNNKYIKYDVYTSL
ncbi:ADP-ribose pyrophosphatase YjhB, NUDIX family [Paenibacillus sp. 1_12]|uniref:NUDIX domain-containing protein n=1 Tax=Paenibacillus sp. 1_12 TaxID=1566278 RepID=UPI0008F42E29|nr:NUDIX hydrolase [Paenibacillus sp. 1_12]SFL00780.1 ADP-ribose pyrophosphatase YjhB, NUDIX family [Paenibacillus sp. 1_12]